MNVNIPMILITISMMILFIHQVAAFQQQKYTNNVTTFSGNSFVLDNSQIDTMRPIVNITNPSYPPTITTGQVLLHGTARDSQSGIRNVTASAHTFPFNGHFNFRLTSQPIPISENNWSQWSMPLIINGTGTFRMVITAIDNAGNPNYAETTINAAVPEKGYAGGMETAKIPKIAFIRSTFTEAAYQKHGFYDFYFKYGHSPVGKNMTNDLDMFTVKTPRSVSEFPENQLKYLSGISPLVPINGTELHNFPNPKLFWIPFIDHVKKAVPNGIVTVMRDEDVNDGHIFHKSNMTNAYDILLLFHNEYVTQAEYDNLRQFVKNGGTTIFIDPNIFYAEVRYDRDNHTITLVKGHDWEFDGKAARRSVHERWYNETKDWVGGSYLLNYIKSNTTFTNNPFNYTHFEEQYVNNPKDKIIIDYGIKFPRDFAEVQSKKNELPVDKRLEEVVVATYALDYGKGKVIMLGLYGQNLAKNPSFMRFFDNDILPKALCPKFESCLIH